MIDNTILFRARVKMLQRKQEHRSDATSTSATRPHFGTGDHHRTPASHSPTSPSAALRGAALSKTTRASNSNYRLYSAHARQIVRNISELRDLVLDKRKEYIHSFDATNLNTIYGVAAMGMSGGMGTMSDGDRRRFDADSDLAVKQCSKLINDLETQIRADESLRKEDEVRHLRFVVHLLNVYLKNVIRVIAQLRAVHLKKMQHVRKICRLASLVDMYESSIAAVKDQEEARERRLERLHDEVDSRTAHFHDADDTTPDGAKSGIDGWMEDAPEEPSNSDRVIKKETLEGDQGDEKQPALKQRKAKGKKNGKVPPAFEPATKSVYDQPDSSHANKHISLQETEPVGPFGELSRDEQAQLVVENKELFARFAHTNQEIQRIESTMSEIQRLQEIFTEKVVQQDADIESIHLQTVQTLDNLEMANEYIRQAIRNTASRRVICLFCLIVLTLTLLFLHWYNP